MRSSRRVLGLGSGAVGGRQSLQSGRAESFPVEGEPCFPATACVSNGVGDRSGTASPPVAGTLDRLPEFGRFLQIESLAPLPACLAGPLHPARFARRSDWGRLWDAALRHGQIPFPVANRQRAVQPAFHSHVRSPQPSRDRFGLDQVQLSVPPQSIIVAHLPGLHMTQGSRQVVAPVSLRRASSGCADGTVSLQQPVPEPSRNSAPRVLWLAGNAPRSRLIPSSRKARPICVGSISTGSFSTPGSSRRRFRAV